MPNLTNDEKWSLFHSRLNSVMLTCHRQNIGDTRHAFILAREVLDELEDREGGFWNE